MTEDVVLRAVDRLLRRTVLEPEQLAAVDLHLRTLADVALAVACHGSRREIFELTARAPIYTGQMLDELFIEVG